MVTLTIVGNTTPPNIVFYDKDALQKETQNSPNLVKM